MFVCCAVVYNVFRFVSPTPDSHRTRLAVLGRFKAAVTAVWPGCRVDTFGNDHHWTGVVDQPWKTNVQTPTGLKTSRTFVSCAQLGAKTTVRLGKVRLVPFMKDNGAKAYNGAFETYRGKWCPSYYQQGQKTWVTGDHGMIDRCELACELDPACKAFTYVERSAANRDAKALRKQVALKPLREQVALIPKEEPQCHLSKDCSPPLVETPDRRPPIEWNERIFTTFVKTAKGVKVNGNIAKLQADARRKAMGLYRVDSDE